MQLKCVTLNRIHVPFRKPVEHASARRTFSDNLLIHVIGEDGTEGWGETIARDYVTGDSTESAMAHLLRIPAESWQRPFISADDILHFCTAAGLEDANVARCAVEIALLDMLARRAGSPLDQFLASCWPDLAQIRNQPPFRYSGPIGVGSALQTFKAALKLRLYGVASVKIKLTNNLRADRLRLKIARAVLGSKADIRVDANESWGMDHAVSAMPTIREFRVSAIEQPFHKTRLIDAEALSSKEDVCLIFDESLCSEADAAMLCQRSGAKIFALKLAKLGGFASSLRIAKIALQNSIPIQISCQVGETAILSAAGRHLASLCANLKYLEGSYDRFFLNGNVTSEDISVGKGGFASALRGAGLGISIDKSLVKGLTTESHRLFGRIRVGVR